MNSSQLKHDLHIFGEYTYIIKIIQNKHYFYIFFHMSVERPALLPLIFIEKAIARFGYVRAMAFVVKNIEPFPPPVIWLRL